MIEIVIGADIVPTPSNFANFQNAKMEEIIDKDLLDIINSADFRIFNLETPLCNNQTPIDKCGPNISAPCNTVIGLQQLLPSFLCLANNHIMDHGPQGLETTLNTLQSHNISYCGIGSNVSAAKHPFILEKDGLKIGVYTCCEHEFSTADEHHPGANPFDPLNTPDDIYALKSQTDFVIVLYHGGREHYRYPSPELQKRCRKMADKGADIIICQHSHCIGCKEQYKHSEIIYGQGNFIFDLCDDDEWQTSLLIKLQFSKQKYNCTYIPFVKNGAGIKSPDTTQATQIISDFEQRSQAIASPNFIYQQYQKEAQQALPIYIATFRNNNIYAMRNYLDCEAHHEIFSFGLKHCSCLPEKFSTPKQKKFFGKIKSPNGKRSFYLFGFKIFSYKKA